MRRKNLIAALFSVLTLTIACDKIDENEFPEVISSSSDMISFKINGEFETQINQDTKEIVAIIPPVYDLKQLSPTIETSRGATIVPESGATMDFSSAVSYEITARDEIGKSTYKIVLEASGISSFKIEDTELPIDYESNTITQNFKPADSPISDLSKVRPVIEISEGATISPASGEEVDFRTPVLYTVTSAKGSIIEYLVTITIVEDKDFFVDFLSNWTVRGSSVFDDSGETLLYSNDWGWANSNGAIKNEVDLQGNFVIELKAKINAAEDIWPATGFFVGGELNGTNPIYLFALKAQEGKTNLIGFHGKNGWIEGNNDIEVDGLNNREWTIMRMEKNGNEIKSYINDVLVSTMNLEGVSGTLGLFGERLSAEFEYISFKPL